MGSAARAALLVLLAAIVASWVWVLQPWRLVEARLRGRSSSFRLLLVADPQMEGWGSSLHSRLNTAFNDWYLWAVVSRSALLGGATHVVVMGDVFSYQFLDGAEFASRTARFRAALGAAGSLPVVTLAGNHDIGYGAEQTAAMRERWERAVAPLRGRVALDARHELVWCNSMRLDEPGQEDEWSFLERAAAEAKSEGRRVVLLLHVPLHKPAGSCPGDSPLIRRDSLGRVTGQNLVSFSFFCCFSVDL
jgi:hypothetical protein